MFEWLKRLFKSFFRRDTSVRRYRAGENITVGEVVYLGQDRNVYPLRAKQHRVPPVGVALSDIKAGKEGRFAVSGQINE